MLPSRTRSELLRERRMAGTSSASSTHSVPYERAPHTTSSADLGGSSPRLMRRDHRALPTAALSPAARRVESLTDRDAQAAAARIARLLEGAYPDERSRARVLASAVQRTRSTSPTRAWRPDPHASQPQQQLPPPPPSQQQPPLLSGSSMVVSGGYPGRAGRFVTGHGALVSSGSGGGDGNGGGDEPLPPPSSSLLASPIRTSAHSPPSTESAGGPGRGGRGVSLPQSAPTPPDDGLVRQLEHEIGSLREQLEHSSARLGQGIMDCFGALTADVEAHEDRLSSLEAASSATATAEQPGRSTEKQVDNGAPSAWQTMWGDDAAAATAAAAQSETAQTREPASEEQQQLAISSAAAAEAATARVADMAASALRRMAAEMSELRSRLQALETGSAATPTPPTAAAAHTPWKYAGTVPEPGSLREQMEAGAYDRKAALSAVRSATVMGTLGKASQGSDTRGAGGAVNLDG
jgi:hypothetical protein